MPEILTNPVAIVVVVLVAIVLGKVIKVSAKILKWIILLGAAYLIVTQIGLF